jgi:hypothetical protein
MARDARRVDSFLDVLQFYILAVAHNHYFHICTRSLGALALFYQYNP